MGGYHWVFFRYDNNRACPQDVERRMRPEPRGIVQNRASTCLGGRNIDEVGTGLDGESCALGLQNIIEDACYDRGSPVWPSRV